jgi:hypothetical protein
MSRTWIIVVAVLACLAPAAVGGQAPADLREAFRLRDQAIDKIDVATWVRLTAPDFTVVTEKGRLLTRAERIEVFKSDTPAASPSVCAEERITMFANGNAAVRACRSGDTWWNETWEKAASGWRAVAVQGTPISK